MKGKISAAVSAMPEIGGTLDAEGKGSWNIGSIYDGINAEKRKVFLKFDCITQTKADCENCLAVHTCGISCIAVNWGSFNDIFKPHPNQCKMNNLFFAEAMRVHYILESEKNSYFMKKFYGNGQRNKKNNRGKSRQKHINETKVSNAKNGVRSGSTGPAFQRGRFASLGRNLNSVRS